MKFKKNQWAHKMTFNCNNSDGDGDTTDDESDKTTMTTNVVGNDIYFYEDISRNTILNLNKIIKMLEIKLMKKAAELSGYTPEINIFIHSDGGDVYAGLSGMDHIKNCKVHINTIADGHVASAATFLLLGGHSKYIKEHTQVLIHQMTINGFWGKYDELKDEMNNSTKCMSLISNIYKNKTTVPSKLLKKFMKKDIYISAEECIKHSIVDGFFCP
jgi:ATP-dependent protease ClpP protease subunit